MGIFRDDFGNPKYINIALGAVVLAIGLKIGSNNIDYSSGTRVGVINKVSERGVVFKTYEGQMALEGVVSSGNNVGANV